MSVVRGYAKMLVEQVEDPNIDSDTFLSNIERTISLAEKSIVLRRIADSEFQLQEIALASVVEEQAAKVRAEFPDATFHIDTDSQAKITTSLHLDIVIRELLENAIKHSPSGTCDVQIESTVDDVCLTVSDDGPGLPDHEQSVLSGIPETALRHGQGLGLWIVNWAVSATGGSITTMVSDAGTEISVTIPRINADNALTME
jgi:signal transduction histidine kinase